MFQSILHPPGAERNMSRHSSVTRALAPAIALLGWTALLLQLALSLRLTMESGHGLGYGLMVYFGFFTILTNLLAAVTLTAPLLAPGSALGRTLSRPGVVTAVTGYMVLVGVTYSLLLRRLWAPTGWQKVADIALHDALPLLVLAYWWVAVPKAGLRWAEVPRWLVFPVGYFVYMLARGALTGLYPYGFIDPSVLGYGRALWHAVLLCLAFLVVAALLLAVGRAQTRSERVASTP
jgi:hypothetical protein